MLLDLPVVELVNLFLCKTHVRWYWSCLLFVRPTWGGILVMSACRLTRLRWYWLSMSDCCQPLLWWNWLWLSLSACCQFSLWWYWSYQRVVGPTCSGIDWSCLLVNCLSRLWWYWSCLLVVCPACGGTGHLSLLSDPPMVELTEHLCLLSDPPVVELVMSEPPSQTTVLEGSDLVMVCHANSHPPPHLYKFFHKVIYSLKFIVMKFIVIENPLKS